MIILIIICMCVGTFILYYIVTCCHNNICYISDTYVSIRFIGLLYFLYSQKLFHDFFIIPTVLIIEIYANIYVPYKVIDIL